MGGDVVKFWDGKGGIKMVGRYVHDNQPPQREEDWHMKGVNMGRGTKME